MEHNPHAGMPGPGPANPLVFGEGLLLAPGLADSPNLYDAELRRVEESLPTEVRRYITNRELWSVPDRYKHDIGEFARRATRAVAPGNTHSANQVFSPLVALASWAHVSKGLPLKYQLLLSTRVVAKWQAAAQKGTGASTLGAYRRQLARVAHAMGVVHDTSAMPRLSRKSRTEPYSADEIRRLLLWARSVRSPKAQKRALAVIALGAGAGLEGHELIPLRTGNIIHESGMWIRVDGPRPRLIPIADEWRPRIRRLTELVGPGELLYPRDPGDAPHTTAWLLNVASEYRPSPRRLRATWITEQLRTSTDDAALLAWSGIANGSTLAGYLPFLGPVDVARHRELIRLNSPVPDDEPTPTESVASELSATSGATASESSPTDQRETVRERGPAAHRDLGRA